MKRKLPYEDVDPTSSTIYRDSETESIEPPSMSPEEEAIASQIMEENRKRAEERANLYRHYHGDSDSYAEADAISIAGVPIKIFVDPAKALEQAKIDYKDAYDYFRYKLGLRPVSKNNIDDYIRFGAEMTVEDPELAEQCRDLRLLFIKYKNSYNHQ